MRRLLLMAAGMGLALGNSGCLLNIYSSDPRVRMEQLMVQSEDLRQIHEEWRRIWFTDQPSHLTWERTNGGLEPGGLTGLTLGP
jgi:hypothetical protein